jgi:hypothetical protein
MLQSDLQDEELVKDLAGTVYLAGSDTTVSAVASFFLAAVVYPEFQRRAHEELDRVVGRERLPEFADKTELPYMEAVMRECFRWLPALPTGMYSTCRHPPVISPMSNRRTAFNNRRYRVPWVLHSEGYCGPGLPVVCLYLSIFSIELISMQGFAA